MRVLNAGAYLVGRIMGMALDRLVGPYEHIDPVPRTQR